MPFAELPVRVKRCTALAGGPDRESAFVRKRTEKFSASAAPLIRPVLRTPARHHGANAP